MTVNKTRFILMFKHQEKGVCYYRSYIIAVIAFLSNILTYILLLKKLLSRNLHPYHICPSLQLEQVGVHNSLSFLQQPAIQKTREYQLWNWLAGPIIPLSWSEKGFQIWMWSLGGSQQVFSLCIRPFFAW